MKRCTMCGATSNSTLVYDLPCEEHDCAGTMIFIAPDPSWGEEPTKPGSTVVVVTTSTLPELTRKLVIARMGSASDLPQVLAFIERRAVALSDLGADDAADLLRNLIVALRTEFRS
jgi:hypothetical protein